MSDLREAAQQALEALEDINGWQSLAPPLVSQAARRTAVNLRAALEQERDTFCDSHCTWRDHHPDCVRAEQPIIEAKINADKSEPDAPERRCGGPGCDMTCCQPVEEPVAWMHTMIDGNVITHRPADLGKHPDRWTPLFTHPPRREWQSLTEEEIRDLWSWSATAEAERTATTQQHAFARAVEAALKERNA